jgi:hypothetical protein
MQERRAVKEPIDIFEGETYYQNYSSPTYYNYVIFMVTISKQDKHKPLGRLAHSLVISDDMCSDFHYVSLTQNEYGGYIVNCILHYNKAVRSSPMGIDDYDIYGFYPLPAVVLPTSICQPSQRSS